MNILAFDTSLNKTYIALSVGDTVVCRALETNEINYHSAYLISGIRQILDENLIDLKNIDLFAVNAGPGSFTGIRVGVTVAKTLAKELNKPVIGASSLDILRETYKNLDPDVVLDARREMFYINTGDNAGGEISLIPYNDAYKHLSKDVIICDKSSYAHLLEIENPSAKPDLIVFEEDGAVNLGPALIDIARSKHSSGGDFGWYNLKPQYIQAPPIHKK